MSAAARKTIGIAMSIAACCLGLAGLSLGNQLPNGPMPLYSGSLFFLTVSIACFSKGSRSLTLRLIGAAVFWLYFSYATRNIGNGINFKAVRAFLVFGIPSGYLAIFGRLPKLNWLYRAFNSYNIEQGKEVAKQSSEKSVLDSEK